MMRAIALSVLLGLAHGAPQVAAPLAVKKPSGHVQLSAQQQKTMHSGCVNACRPSPVESKCVTACEAKMYKCIDETGPNETPKDTEKCQGDVLSHYTKTKGVEKKEEKKEAKKGEAKKEGKKEEKKAEKKAKMFLQIVRDDDEADEEASDDIETTAASDDEVDEESASEDESAEDSTMEEEEEEEADESADEAEEGSESQEDSTEEEEVAEEDSTEGEEADEEASEEDTSSADDSVEDDADASETDSAEEDESLMQTSSKDDDDAETADAEESEDEAASEDSEDADETSVASEEDDAEEAAASEEEEVDADETAEASEEEDSSEEAADDSEASDEEETSEPEEEEDESFVQVKSSWKPEPCGELQPGVPCVKLYEHPQGSTVVTPCPVDSHTDPSACSAYFGDKADDAKCPQITCPKALGVTMKLTCGGGCCPTCWAPDHVIAVDRHTTVDDAAVVDPAPQAPGSCGGVKCFKLNCAPGYSEGHVNGACCYSCVPGR